VILGVGRPGADGAAGRGRRKHRRPTGREPGMGDRRSPKATTTVLIHPRDRGRDARGSGRSGVPIVGNRGRQPDGTGGRRVSVVHPNYTKSNWFEPEPPLKPGDGVLIQPAAADPPIRSLNRSGGSMPARDGAPPQGRVGPCGADGSVPSACRARCPRAGRGGAGKCRPPQTRRFSVRRSRGSRRCREMPVTLEGVPFRPATSRCVRRRGRSRLWGRRRGS
jgi:hypothetical protein